LGENFIFLFSTLEKFWSKTKHPILQRKLNEANSRIYSLERELLGKNQDLDKLAALQESLNAIKAESTRHHANFELEKEKTPFFRRVQTSVQNLTP